MYFWNIKSLKKDISEHRLSEAHIFYYILIYVVLSAASLELFGYVAAGDSNSWDYIQSSLSIVITIAGTIAVYRANGGAAGKRFAEKYFSIGLVVLIRFFPIFVLMLFAMFGYYGWSADWSSPDVEADFGTGWIEVTLVSGLYVAYYARFVKHVSDTAKTSG